MIPHGNDVPYNSEVGLHSEVPGFKRGPGRPRTNWRSTANKDLLRMVITWEEATVAAQNGLQSRRSVASCINLDGHLIKVKLTLSDINIGNRVDRRSKTTKTDTH